MPAGMRALFLQAPSFEGFDGGAGSRYQARREIRSFWYPTWLAQVAALTPNSTVIDATPHGLKLSDVLARAGDFDLAVLHTSTPSFGTDVKAATALKTVNPRLKVGFVGAKVAVEPDASLEMPQLSTSLLASSSISPSRKLQRAATGAPSRGLSYRDANWVIRHNEARTILWNMDALPFVTPIYKRDLKIEKYFIGYLKHPYVSFYTGRGCKSRCTFCLWPQTVGGHRYRTRSVGHVMDEMRWARQELPQVKEFFLTTTPSHTTRPGRRLSRVN